MFHINFLQQIIVNEVILDIQLIKRSSKNMLRYMVKRQK